MPSLYNIGRVKVEVEHQHQKDFKDFLGSLVLMIPSEVVALYFVGKGFAINSPIINLGIWGFICWIIVGPARFWGATEVIPERFGRWTKWINVTISLIAFPAWVLALGGKILNFALDVNTASLAILVVSVVGGWFYTTPNLRK